MIADFEAKYHYLSWRPITGDSLKPISDGNPGHSSPTRLGRPLRTTPNHPEYPAAHAFHSSAVTSGIGSVLRHR